MIRNIVLAYDRFILQLGNNSNTKLGVLTNLPFIEKILKII